MALTKEVMPTPTNIFHDEHIEITAVYNKTIKDFSLNATGSLDIHSTNTHNNFGNTNGGFNTPNLYTLGNSKDAPSLGDTRSALKDNGLFRTTSWGWRKIINIDATVRQDWYSSLPKANNRIFSKSLWSFICIQRPVEEQRSMVVIG